MQIFHTDTTKCSLTKECSSTSGCFVDIEDGVIDVIVLVVSAETDSAVDDDGGGGDDGDVDEVPFLAAAAFGTTKDVEAEYFVAKSLSGFIFGRKHSLLFIKTMNRQIAFNLEHYY